jgi:hypothetical protein
MDRAIKSCVYFATPSSERTVFRDGGDVPPIYEAVVGRVA